MTKQMLKYLGGQLSVEVEKGLEAKRYLSSILDNLYSEALRKEGGNIGPVLIDNLILEAEEKTQKYMKEKYPPAMNGTTRGTENTVPKAGVYQQTTEQPPQPTSKTASASKPQPPVNTAQAEAQAGKSLRLWLKQNTPDVLNTSYSTPEELLEIIKAQYPDKYEEAVSLISNFNAGGNR